MINMQNNIQSTPEKHKPHCKINVQCLVYHPDGKCPGPYGTCTCDQPTPEQKDVWERIWRLVAPENHMEIDDAIQSLLKSQQERLRERVMKIKRICGFCKEGFSTKNHYMENGVHYCILKAQSPTNKFPTIDMVGSEEDDGYNQALDDILKLLQ